MTFYDDLSSLDTSFAGSAVLYVLPTSEGQRRSLAMAAKSDTTITVTVTSDTEALLADHQHTNSEDENATETKGGAIIKRC